MSTRKPHSKPARFLLVANIDSPHVSLESSRWGVSWGTEVKQIFLVTVSKEHNMQIEILLRERQRYNVSLG